MAVGQRNQAPAALKRTKTMTNKTDIYVIMTLDGIDQIVNDKTIATREVKDLRAMDIGKVWIKTFSSWEAADNFETNFNL